MTNPGPAARLLDALDAANTAGLNLGGVMAATGLEDEPARALVARAVTAGKAYRPPGARRIYSTAPY